MQRIAGLAVLAVMTAACSGGGNGDTDGEVSMAEAADVAEASGLRPQAGQYRVSSEVTNMEIPGVPDGMPGAQGGFSTTSEYCLTEEEANAGFEEMMQEGQDGDCSYERFNLDGGEMDAVLVCSSPEGEMRMEMQGTATPTSSDMTATMNTNIPGMGEGKMTMRVKHERIGDCADG